MRLLLLDLAPRAAVLRSLSVWLALGLLPNLSPLLADEPPIRPRNSTWNSYSSSDQYYPGWGNHDTVCRQCPVPSNRLQLPGWRGTPYVDQYLACPGCRAVNQGNGCQSASSSAIVAASVHWPRPFSNFWSDRSSGNCGPHAWHHSGMGTRLSAGHIFDRLDPLAELKLVPSPRQDSGYCGPQCDPYGKLGRSQQPTASTLPATQMPHRGPAFPAIPNYSRESAPGPFPPLGQHGSIPNRNPNIRMTSFSRPVSPTYSGFSPTGTR